MINDKIDKTKKTVNRLHSPILWVLQNWCRDNHHRLADLRVTRLQAAQMATEELASHIDDIRTRKQIRRPIVIKPSNIKSAYKVMGLVWHRGSRAAPHPVQV